MIRAEAHSDDYIHEVKFDAEPWFRQADDEKIVALAGCCWGGDYPADRVVLDMEGTNADLDAMLDYCRKTQGRRDPVGFECHVDQPSALTWLSNNQPHLYLQLTKEGE